MSELTGKVYELIRRENLILPGDTVIAGVSGGADSVCMLCVLLALRDSTSGPEVLVGAGVNAGVIRTFRQRFPQVRSFHMSGKGEKESAMGFRREGVPMGAPGFSEWHIQQTDPDAVRAARAALDEP